MPPRVLVTGGAGYVGSVLCARLLSAGYRVTVLDRLDHGQASLLHLCDHPGFEFHFGDVRDEALVKSLLAKHDVVVPLAAIVGAPACDLLPQEAKAINLDAIVLLDRLRSKEQLVLYPTTNSGYGTKSGDVYCTEDTPLEPISLYGRTKVDAENHLLESGGAITLRLATLFGLSTRMRLDLMVNHFTWAAVKDRYLVIFEAHFKRNYLHVQDMADCFVHCIEHRDRMLGRAFNVGLDKANLSKGELAELIQVHVPEFYVHFAEIGQDPDKRNYVVSNQRLRDAGFEAKRSLDQGVQELIRGYRMIRGGPLKNA
jgi:nucleoside-diphosphate-sugar epimerase